MVYGNRRLNIDLIAKGWNLFEELVINKLSPKWMSNLIKNVTCIKLQNSLTEAVPFSFKIRQSLSIIIMN